ncbi:MAG: hypothetical protein M2R45_01832 [Verrucomicrobia subdivision 3 bacterium]|nr:hypothetical protein [Limisphaerales bacterium]MCS1415632.1 hypothetical protein [Limisphaerales bacterium]
MKAINIHIAQSLLVLVAIFSRSQTVAQVDDFGDGNDDG